MAAATALDKATLQKLFSPDFIMGRVTPHITEHYDIKETLGEGQFGVVRKAVNKETGEVCACKTVTKARLGAGGEDDDVCWLCGTLQMHPRDHLGGPPRVGVLPSPPAP